MSFKCVCSALFLTLVVTLITALILGLLGVTTVTLVSPTIVGLILFAIGFISSIISFVALLYRNCNGGCRIRCFTSRLFLLFAFSVGLVVFTLIGYFTFLATTTITLLVFSIGLFLLLGILFTEISILFPLLNRNNVE